MSNYLLISQNMIYKNRDTYYKLHKYCPKCGNDKIKQSYNGYIYYDNKPYKDENSAKCYKCNWNGIIDDLKEKSIK